MGSSRVPNRLIWPWVATVVATATLVAIEVVVVEVAVVDL